MNNKTYTTTYKNLYSTCQRPVSAHHKLKLTTWNCRGLTSGEPYIHELDNKGSDIIVITEHWLWPYETKRLSEVHPDYAAECTTDSRLHENSDLIRGCGGVGVMFRKSLHVSPISSVSSDCICGIQIYLTSPDPQCITVLGVYLSCADQGMDAYCSALVELEQLITTSSRFGPVLIAGDFNAHLGPLGGPRGLDTPNQQGILLKQLISHCDLYVVFCDGPQFTFWNTQSQTSVDYIISCLQASQLIHHCFVYT